MLIFLDFHSALKTYIVTFIGYDVNEKDEFSNILSDKNALGSEAIRSSFNYIINDFSKNSQSIYFDLFRDVFSLLLESFDIVLKQNLDKEISPFDVLNSAQVLYQFIIFYVCYSIVEDYSKFKELIESSTPTEGGGKDDEELEGDGIDGDGIDGDGIDGDEIEGDGEEIEMVEESRSPDNSQEMSQSPTLSQPIKEVIEIPEYVFITHNNLLTTITRGMFIKLGIWKKIFFPDRDINEINPEEYIFGFEQLNQISYTKLVELYPITPETGGHRNNEFLILEILILKRLLVEMSPSKTLTFGAKIDDDLKNFMDTFYNYYYAKPEFEQINIDNVTVNPNLTGEDISEEERRKMEEEAEEMFAKCEEDCEEDMDFREDYEGFIEGGGKKQIGEIEMTEIKRKPNLDQQPLSTISPSPLLEPVVSNNVPDVVSDVQNAQEGTQSILGPVISSVEEEVQPIVSSLEEEVQPIVSDVVSNAEEKFIQC